jgi:CCS family citrate carrier protein
METRVGVIPVPVLAALLALIGYFLSQGRLPAGLPVMIAVIAVGGFLCAEVGKRLPVLRNIGGAAILATFIPSALVYYEVLPEAIAKPVTEFTISTQFLYLFITAVVVGSILGMDRAVLIRGFIKIFVPLATGSVAAIAAGTAIGTALGLGTEDALLFVVIPIMAGGIGEGAIPLSIGYADVMHLQQGDVFARVLPPVMFGSLTAILLAGFLNYVGKKYPHLTGEGRLEPGERDDMNPRQHEVPAHMDVDHIAAAGMFAIALYLAGLAGQEAFGFPAPVTMLFLAVVAKLTQAVPPKTQDGAYTVYRFFRVAVTYPLLFAVGVALTPWEALVAAFHWKNLVTIVATVATLMTTGWCVGRWVKLYPVEAAIVNACHSGQGGTGDVAILTAANRMQLMPFAQIATRIGGAITVTLTLIVLRVFS